MKKETNQSELGKYRTFGLTLLQFMGLLAIAGIAITVILKLFF